MLIPLHLKHIDHWSLILIEKQKGYYYDSLEQMPNYNFKKLGIDYEEIKANIQSVF